MKTVIKILKTISVVLIVAMLGVNFYGVVKYRLFGDALPSFFGNYLYVNNSDNMRPYINNGDFIIASEELNYYSDDVVIYGEYQKYEIKRITSLDGINVRLTSDTTDDTLSVNKDLIIGKVNIIVPYLGYLFNLFKNYLFVIGLVVFTFFLFLIDEKKKKYTGLDYNMDKY